MVIILIACAHTEWALREIEGGCILYSRVTTSQKLLALMFTTSTSVDVVVVGHFTSAQALGPCKVIRLSMASKLSGGPAHLYILVRLCISAE